MIISSELTGKTYKTVEDCLAAEKAYRKEEVERARKLDEAYEEAIAACNRYLELAGVKVKIKEEKVFEGVDDLWDELYNILMEKDK